MTRFSRILPLSKTFRTLLVVLTAATGATSPVVHAAGSIMFDFGSGATNNGNVPTLSTEAKGPAHNDPTLLGTGAIPNSETTWNGPGSSATISSGLLYSDGSAATGVSIDFGIENGADTGIIDWSLPDATGISQRAFTVAGIGALYTTNLGRSYIRPDTANRSLGLRITGLAAGTYDIYSVAKILSSQSDRQEDIKIFGGIEGTLPATTTYSGFTTTTIANSDTAAAEGTWAVNVNYSLIQLTVTSVTDTIVLVSEQFTAAKQAPFTSLQIVAVPEPGAMVLSLLGTVGLMFHRRRR